jgi:hypothetical protein
MSEAGKVTIAKIIGKDDNDVRWCRRDLRHSA